MSDSIEQLKGVKDRLLARADNAYIDYLGRCGVKECLGFEAKIDKGIFGGPGLEAHKKAAEKLGAHRALMEAHAMIDNLIKQLK